MPTFTLVAPATKCKCPCHQRPGQVSADPSENAHYSSHTWECISEAHRFKARRIR